MFYHITGITTPPSNNEIEKVTLQISQDYIGYIKNKKIHHSQKVVETDSGDFIVEFDLIINQELCNLIIGLGINCKVLEPQILVEKVKSILNESLSKYN